MESRRPIERIYVATYRGDVRLARMCVCSIRYWYPHIPIFLIKDELHGKFCTQELEQYWEVRLFESEGREFGWGLSKLEPLFQETTGRFLVVDADTVFVGPVLETIDASDTDMVVDEEVQPLRRLQEIYFDLERLRAFDPDFVYPGFSFNTGQWVGCAGLFRRSDFGPFLTGDLPQRLKHPLIFKNGEQGLFNYLVMKRVAAGRFTLGRIPFMIWRPADAALLELNKIRTNSPYRSLIHWAGPKPATIGKMMRGDILQFFERKYYARIPRGNSKRLARHLATVVYSKRQSIAALYRYLRRPR